MRYFWKLSSALTLLALTTLGLFGWYWLAERSGWFDPQPPTAWLEAASKADVLTIPNKKIAYWGKPDARYSVYATRSKQPPKAIVVHFNYPKSLFGLVRYGHKRDFSRKGASFGYHFYIGRSGKIVQGAPLSVRTNHIKSTRNPRRKSTARHLWSGNTIGVSLVAACDPVRAPVWGKWNRCSRETPTEAQLIAGRAVVRALQQRYDIPCVEIYGHGDLQTDRDSFEGKTLSRLVRSQCPPPPLPAAKSTTSATATSDQQKG